MVSRRKISELVSKTRRNPLVYNAARELAYSLTFPEGPPLLAEALAEEPALATPDSRLSSHLAYAVVDSVIEQLSPSERARLVRSAFRQVNRVAFLLEQEGTRTPFAPTFEGCFSLLHTSAQVIEDFACDVQPNEAAGAVFAEQLLASYCAERELTAGVVRHVTASWSVFRRELLVRRTVATIQAALANEADTLSLIVCEGPARFSRANLQDPHFRATADRAETLLRASCRLAA